MHRDFVISEFGRKVEVRGDDEPDLRISFVDTGVWRNVGNRLLAIRSQVNGDDMFLANYSDGLSDAPLTEMIDFFERSGKIGCFLAVQPNFSYHLVQFGESGRVTEIKTSHQSEIWINGGFFIFRREIFDYMKDGEELVSEPFERLIAANQLVAFKHHGFWASMDTLRDKQALEDMVERGQTPWLPRLKKRPVQ